MSFLHILKPEERQLLRKIVKHIHFQYYPDEHKTDYEADKMISTIGPEVIQMLIKSGKDNNVANI